MRRKMLYDYIYHIILHNKTVSTKQEKKTQLKEWEQPY